MVLLKFFKKTRSRRSKPKTTISKGKNRRLAIRKIKTVKPPRKFIITKSGRSITGIRVRKKFYQNSSWLTIKGIRSGKKKFKYKTNTYISN